MVQKTMGSFLAALRRAAGMTQKQLAEKLNVSDKAVSRWERDENAPDLSLIPVIAEIFGITSDELLRGERITQERSPEKIAEKCEKQIKRILNETITTYKIQCSVTVAVAWIGLIAAMIGNLGFLRARVGFLCGCILFVVALLCQTIWGTLARSRMKDDSLENGYTASARRKLAYGAEMTYGIIFTIFSFTLPLVVYSGDTYVGLNFDSWLSTGALFAVAAALVTLIVSVIINLKLGYWSTEPLKTAVWKLRIRCIALLLISISGIALGHIVLAEYLSNNRHLLTDYLEFNSWEDLRHYMETPLDSNGNPLEFRTIEMENNQGYLIYANEDYEYRIKYSELFEEIYAHVDADQPIVKYRKLNMYVSSIEFSGGEDLLPVYVCHMDQAHEANRIGEIICGGYAILYPIALITVFLIYRKRTASLN